MVLLIGAWGPPAPAYEHGGNNHHGFSWPVTPVGPMPIRTSPLADFDPFCPFCSFCPAAVLAEGLPLGPAESSVPASLSPLSAVPLLSSLPTAEHRIYLNFVGATIGQWGGGAGYNTGTTPAYDQDGDTTTFSAGELNSIREIWARVAEKYSPFNIDVTTINPGSEHFAWFDSLQVVIGGRGDWLGTPAGGVAAYVGGYYNSARLTTDLSKGTVFVFPGHLGNGGAKYVGEASAHEAGHALGLFHQSKYNGKVKAAEYGPGTWPGDPSNPWVTPGTGYKSPTMGLSYYADRGIWWQGQSSQSYLAIQTDMTVLGNNNFGYRPANSNSSSLTAAALNSDSGTLAVGGIIRTTDDKYYYSFTTPGGPAAFNMNVARYVNLDGSTTRIGILDAKLRLLDSQGNPVGVAANEALPASPSLDESLTLNLPGGQYYVVAESQGNYGDIGQFTLGGTFAPVGPAVLQLGNLVHATIIAGGTGALGATVGNAAAPFNRNLNYTFSASVLSGSANLAAASASSGSLGAGASRSHQVAAASNVPGNHAIALTASDPAATGGLQSVVATLTVLDHAAPSLTLVSPVGAVAIAGTSGATAQLVLSNGAAGASGRAVLDVVSLGAGVQGPLGARLVASGSQQAYTAALDTSAPGQHVRAFKVRAGDDQSLSGAAAPADVEASVSYQVLDHANASFSPTAVQTLQTIDFGNLLQGAAPQSRTFSVHNLAANVAAGLTANLKLVGFSASGDAALGSDLAVFTALAAGSGNLFTATIDTSRLTTVGQKTITLAASQLLDDSLLPGASGSNSGDLTLVIRGTVGAAALDASNVRGTFGAALTAAVPAGGSYAGLQSAAGNSAKILSGNASTAANVSMAWRAPRTGDPDSGRDPLISNVVELSGLAIVDSQTRHGSFHTDIYTLQMSYDWTAVTGLSEADAALAGLLALYFLDMGPDGLAGSADDQWVPAVLGNFGSKRHRFVGVMAYDPDDLDLELGDYGVNTATHTVWAILDHTSQFGVVPEPSGLVLLAAAAAALLVARRFISRATAGAR